MATSGGRPQQSAGAAANILDGFQAFTATAAATTIITVPAGRTWVGTVSVSVDCRVDAAATVAGQATGVVSLSGAGSTPPAGNLFQVACRAGAGAAGGTTGSSGENWGATPLTVVAPVGNAVLVQFTPTITGNAGDAAVSAIGVLE